MCEILASEFEQTLFLYTETLSGQSKNQTKILIHWVWKIIAFMFLYSNW